MIYFSPSLSLSNILLSLFWDFGCITFLWMLIHMEFQGGKCNFYKMVFNLKKLKKQGGSSLFLFTCYPVWPTQTIGRACIHPWKISCKFKPSMDIFFSTRKSKYLSSNLHFYEEYNWNVFFITVHLIPVYLKSLSKLKIIYYCNILPPEKNVICQKSKTQMYPTVTELTKDDVSFTFWWLLHKISG